MFFTTKSKERGFTLIELLVVIAIIGILVSIVMMSLSQSRLKGRDAGRKIQTQEILKAVELYLSDYGAYPAVTAGGVPLTNAALQTLLSGGTTKYLGGAPQEPDRYHYCSNGSSMLLAVNTETDNGPTGSEYCYVIRGVGPNYGCTYVGNGSDIDADDSCSIRFR